MAGRAARRKSRRCRRGRASAAARRPSERPAVDRRFPAQSTMNGALRKASACACPFAGQERADGIDQPPARPDQLGARCRAAAPAARQAGRAARASAASAPSGLRRQVPLPEQGASTSTRSAVPAQSASAVELAARVEQPGFDLRAGPLGARRRAATAARGCCRWRGSCAPGAAAASASVLPPAPAHRSTSARPSRGAQASAISWLPSSWTSTRPSTKAGCSSTRLSAAGAGPTG